MLATGRKSGASRFSWLTAPPCFPVFKVLAYEAQCHLVNGNKPDLAAFAMHPEVHDALAGLNITQAQKAKLLTAQPVI